MKRGWLSKAYRRVTAPKQYQALYERDCLTYILEQDMLLMIDMQTTYLPKCDNTDNTEPAWELLPHEKDALAYQVKKVEEAVENNASIIYVSLSLRSPYFPQLLEAKENAKRFQQFWKTKQSAFDGTNLELIVKDEKPEVIHVMGLYAPACVYDTVRVGRNRNHPVVVHKDGIISWREQPLEKAVKKIKRARVPVVSEL